MLSNDGMVDGVSSGKHMGSSFDLVVESEESLMSREVRDGDNDVAERGECLTGSEKSVEEVPCTIFSNPDLQMVLGGGEDFVPCEFGELLDSDEDLNPVPLSYFNPEVEWPCNSFDWVMRKVEEIRD